MEGGAVYYLIRAASNRRVRATGQDCRFGFVGTRSFQVAARIGRASQADADATNRWPVRVLAGVVGAARRRYREPKRSTISTCR